jgi:hypothetical protein
VSSLKKYSRAAGERSQCTKVEAMSKDSERWTRHVPHDACRFGRRCLALIMGMTNWVWTRSCKFALLKS